jgi:hypothetical protein
MFTTQPKRFLDAAPPEMPSVAAMMAKSGVKVEAGGTAPEPTPSIETKETTDTPVAKDIPVETTNLPEPTETVKPETQKTQEAETPKVTSPQKEEPRIAAPSLQEVLKQHQPDTVLKELGLDAEAVTLAKELATNPKMKGLFSHWKEKGDVKDYLKALTVDFKEMKPEEVMRHQLREANPELNERQLGILFKRNVIEKYKLDPELYGPDEVEEGQIALMADAKPVRLQLQTEQEKFFIPPPPAKEPQVDVLAEQQKKEAEATAEVKRMTLADPLFREVLQNKKFKIGEGEEAFNFSMKDPESTLNVLYDRNEMVSKLFSEDGLPNMKAQLFISAVLEMGVEKFEKALAKHYKSLGGSAALEPIENPSQPGIKTSTAAPSYQSDAEALAKSGIRYSGGS